MKHVHIEISGDRIIVRGELSEFEASAYLQDALAAQAVHKRRAARRYEALLFYPIILAFTLGLLLALSIL